MTAKEKCNNTYSENAQQAHPSLSFSMWMLIGSEKSPLNSSDSSCARAFLAMTGRLIVSIWVSTSRNLLVYWPSNACSTLIASFALVSKYGICPLDWQKVMALFDDILTEVSFGNALRLSKHLPLSCYLPRQSCFREQPIDTVSTSTLTKNQLPNSQRGSYLDP